MIIKSIYIRFRKLLDNEINILQKISHENIVKVYEILISHNQIFIIMEYCE